MCSLVSTAINYTVPQYKSLRKLLSISACDVLHEPKENVHGVWSHSVLKCCANGKANTYEHSLIITWIKSELTGISESAYYLLFNNGFELCYTLKENHYRLTYILSCCMSICHTMSKMSLSSIMPHNKIGKALFNVKGKIKNNNSNHLDFSFYLQVII